MSRRVLITGGAGFIGSHLADQLVGEGFRVRILDNLHPQVHGSDRQPPAYLDPRAELVVGDVRDPEAVEAALTDVDSVVHLAAAVGVGQSMYQIRDYTDVNNLGTAVLLEKLSQRKVSRLVVASSMSVYGEGRYRASDGGVVDDAERTLDQLREGSWDPLGPDGSALEPVPTPEAKAPRLSSVYALSKYDQERLCLLVGRAYGIPTVALRFFNTYGPRQALSNPYTGVLAIFAARLLNRKSPMIFEDGEQRRDFVSVHDVARACRLALEAKDAQSSVLNVGSGSALSVLEVARRLAVALGRTDCAPQVTRQHRVGDIRHCYADVKLARDVLGFVPEVDLDRGLTELVTWLGEQQAVDRSDSARIELEERGLTV
jgi:dTDP-L-rhamnose 4-epimerase